MWKKNELDNLYNAIYSRKSVRKYEQAVLDQEIINDILKKTDELFSLSPDSLAAFRVLSNKQVKGMFYAKAPHYLAVYAKDDMDSHINAAFKLQQMDLWLSSQGYGSCWLGVPKPVSEVKQANGLPFVIMLAFGRPAEEIHRKAISEFKRKALAEITNLSGMEHLLEPARLTPSGDNRQPWYLTGNELALRLCCKNNIFISKAIFGNMPQVDMGIVLCHLWLAAEKENKFLSFEQDGTPKDIPNGYDYVWTVSLKSADK